MTDKKLAFVADTDIASTVGVGGATRSFAKGGWVGKKKTKKEAHYVTGPVKSQPCKSCSMFRGGRCTLVEGVISPLGHCRFYDPKVKGYQAGGYVTGQEEGEDSPEDTSPEITGNEDADLAARREAKQEPETTPETTLEAPAEQKRWRLATPEERESAKPEESSGGWRLATPEEREAISGTSGQLRAFGEQAAQSAIPTVASLLPMSVGAGLGAGAATQIGAALGSPAGPIGIGVGALIGGAIGGGIAAYGARKAQDYITDKLDVIDRTTEGVLTEANPWSATAGSLAPIAGISKVGPIAGSLGTRLVSAAGMGAIEGAQELATKGEVNPTNLALAVAQGGIFPGLNKAGRFFARQREPVTSPVTPEQQRLLPPPSTEGVPEGGPQIGRTFEGDVIPPERTTTPLREAPTIDVEPGEYQAGRPDLKPAPEEGITEEDVAAAKQQAGQSAPLKVGRGIAQENPPTPERTPDPNSSYQIERDTDIPGNEQRRGYYLTNKEGVRPPVVSDVDENGIPPDVKAAAAGQPIGEGEKSKQEPEKIRNATYTVEGKTYEAPNHILAMDKAVEDLKLGGYDELIDRQPGNTLAEKLAAHREQGDGFITNRGRIVSRDEANDISQRAGQGKGSAPRGIKSEEIQPPKEPVKPTGRIHKDLTQEELPPGKMAFAREAEVAKAAPTEVVRPVNAEGKQVSTKAKQARANTFMEAQQATIDKFHKAFPEGYIPKTVEDRKAYADTVRQHLEEYKSSLPTDAQVRPEIEKYVRSRPRFKGADEEAIKAEVDKRVTEATKEFFSSSKTPGQDWIKKAQQLAKTKTPKLETILKFASDTNLLRSKEGAELVRAETRDEANTALDKRNAAYHENTAANHGGVEPPLSLAPDEIENLHEHNKIARNLEDIFGGPKNKEQQQTLRGDAEKAMEGIRSKSEGLRKLREAMQAARGKNVTDAVTAAEPEKPPEGIENRDNTKPLETNELSGIWKNEEGGLNIDVVKERFTALKDWYMGRWEDLIGKYITPARMGKLGSRERAKAQFGEASLAKIMSLANRASKMFMELGDVHYNYFAKAGADHNYEYMDKYEQGLPQGDKFLDATAKFQKQLFDYIYELEKSFGSKADYHENYLSHMFENKGDYARFDKHMQDKYGPTWFQKKRSFNTLKEAREAGLKLKSDNPIEIMNQRMMSAISMVSKMYGLRELNKMGLAYPIKEMPKGLEGNKSDWLQFDAPDRQSWILAPEVKQEWINAMGRDRLWQEDDLLGSTYRAWMKAKALWVPFKLMLSGFHMLHVAAIHPIMAGVDGWTYTGQKGKFGLPTNVTEAGKAAKGAAKGFAQGLGESLTYPVGAMNKAWFEPLLKRADSWAKARGSDAFEPLFKASENFSNKFEGIRVLNEWNDLKNLASMFGSEHEQSMNLIHEMGMSFSAGADFDIRAAHAFQQAINEGGFKATKGVFDKAAQKIQSLNPFQNYLFKTLIPMWKAVQANRVAQMIMEQHPEYLDNEQLRRVALRKAGKNLDERYGEMFYGSQLWGKMFKNIGQASFLSMAWNVGFVNTLAGAITDNVRSAGILLKMLPERTRTEQAIHDSSNKLAYVASYAAFTMAISAAMSYFFSGKKPEGLDLVYPRAGGENPDGSPRRYTTMHFTREPIMAYSHYQAQGNAINAAAEMLWSKMVLAPFVHFATNRDFFNREMSDPDAAWYKQIFQRAISTGKDMFNPITFESTKQIERSGSTTPGRDKAMAFAGFGPAPAYISKKGIQNRIAHEYYEGPGAGVKPYAQREEAEQRMNLRAQRQRAIQAGDEEAEQKAREGLVATGLKPKAVEKETYGNQDVFQFKRLAPAKKEALVKEMDEEDFKKYVISTMSKNDARRVENGLDPMDRTHARMLAEWLRLGHKIPELQEQ